MTKNKKEFKKIVTCGEKELASLIKIDAELYDIIEVRLDLCSKEFLEKTFVKNSFPVNKPVLLTYRLPGDSSVKSWKDHSEKLLQSIVERFDKKGNYIDLEMDEEGKLHELRFSEFTIIRSMHKFNGIISQEQALKAVKRNTTSEITKFAVYPRSTAELAAFLGAMKKLSENFKIIGIAMGEIGLISRITGDKFGSYATYLSLDTPKAPGQLNLEDFILIRKTLGLES